MRPDVILMERQRLKDLRGMKTPLNPTQILRKLRMTDIAVAIMESVTQ